MGSAGRWRGALAWGGGALVMAGVLAVSSTVPSDAVTNPISGAVLKPGNFEVGWPFLAGERVRVTSGYGGGMGSSLHVGTNRTGSANDHYALDLILPDHPNNGLGRPVVAMASGTVVKAGWATEGWANYGLRVIVRHDFNADGHTYVTLYAHLDALSVSEGDRVERGQQLGTLGDSCQGDTQNRSCPFFGPHLHLAMHRDSSIGGSGTGGSYGGNAVVMEPIEDAQDIVQGNVFTSGNDGQPPGPCQEIAAEGETILEDDGPCMSRFGPPQYWHDEGRGHGGRSFWTYTIDQGQPDNSARWGLHFARAGRYDVDVYVPGFSGHSRQARYVVRHAGREEAVVRDQRSAPDGWLSLGTFDFEAGGDQSVTLADNTGEPYINANDNTQIAFDALRVRPAASCACQGGQVEQEGCGLCGQRQRACDGCQWGDFGPCQDQGVCSPGQREELTCDDGAVTARVCGDACQWGEVGPCGQPGELDAGMPDADTVDGGSPDAEAPDAADNPEGDAAVDPVRDVGPEDGEDASGEPPVTQPATVKGACAVVGQGRRSSPWSALWLVALGLLAARRRRFM